MASDLNELEERLAYCSKKIEPFAKQVDDLVPQLIKTRSEPQFDGTYNIILDIRGDVPISIMSESGMIANELRSILDGLACVLAERNGKTPSGTYFPISKSKAIFADDGEKKMKKLSDDAKDAIRSLRPWGNGNVLLYPLHEADRTRKHTKLSVAVSGVSGLEILGFSSEHGGRGTSNYRYCQIGSVYINHMVFNWSAFYERNISQAPIKRATGVPVALPIRLRYGIVYQTPDVLLGRDVAITVRQWHQLASAIVSRFK